MKEVERIEDAKGEGKALLYVGTDWCTYCAKTTKAIASVMPSYPEVKLFKIDGDDQPDILGEVNAKTYPQLLFFNNGNLIAQRESANAEELKAWIETVKDA
jgi:thioredoxin-like negative regulator of GroEL